MNSKNEQSNLTFQYEMGPAARDSAGAKLTEKAQQLEVTHYLTFELATLEPVGDLVGLLEKIGLKAEIIDWRSDDGKLRQKGAYGECDDGACAVRQTTSTVSMGCVANSRELLENWHDAAREALGSALDERQDTCEIRVWSAGSHYPEDNKIKLHAPTWKEIDENYTPDVRAAVDQIIESFRKSELGGIHIWHGVPGTGKTTALRCIARELEGVAKMHLITDPEAFLSGKTNYVITVLEEGALLNGRGSQLIVLEDAGELVARDARQQVGQGLSRVLNLTDGMLGQNARANIIITTNEETGALHPALMRPGRCASELQFRAFTVAEANEWLAKRGVEGEVDTQKTLAELYAISTGVAPVRVHDNKPAFGFVQ